MTVVWIRTVDLTVTRQQLLLVEVVKFDRQTWNLIILRQNIVKQYLHFDCRGLCTIEDGSPTSARAVISKGTKHGVKSLFDVITVVLLVRYRCKVCTRMKSNHVLGAQLSQPKHTDRACH